MRGLRQELTRRDEQRPGRDWNIINNAQHDPGDKDHSRDEAWALLVVRIRDNDKRKDYYGKPLKTVKHEQKGPEYTVITRRVDTDKVKPGAVS